MISDVLSDSIHEINGYLKNQPSMYASVKPRIDDLLAQMEKLRSDLDNLAYDATGPCASVYEALKGSV